MSKSWFPIVWYILNDYATVKNLHLDYMQRGGKKVRGTAITTHDQLIMSQAISSLSCYQWHKYSIFVRNNVFFKFNAGHNSGKRYWRKRHCRSLFSWAFYLPFTYGLSIEFSEVYGNIWSMKFKIGELYYVSFKSHTALDLNQKTFSQHPLWSAVALESMRILNFQ